MDERQKCPICFEIPEKEIYQCINGHTICETCSISLTLCPQCREAYGPKKIRNRALEEILDDLTFDCRHKEAGCVEKLKRSDITKHGKNCSFFKKPIFLCKILGYENCNHDVNTLDHANTIQHFVQRHNAIIEQGRKVSIWHTDFKSVIETGVNTFWNPILMKVDEDLCQDSLFMIVGKVDVSRKSAVWICMQLYGTEGAFDLVFNLLLLGKHPVLQWKMPTFNVTEFQFEKIINKIRVEMPLDLIKELSTEDGNIKISAVVKPARRKQVENLLTSYPEVWNVASMENQPINAENSVVWTGIECDGCRKKPITGRRYKCLNCRDYDLCERCLTTGTHSQHVLAVLATPEQRRLL